jgi:glutamate racemase
MKIGIFDSGLGGLVITKAIHKLMPKYDFVYLGDTKRVPYGGRSQATVYKFTCQALKHLFEKENCHMVIVACNTSSAQALRKIQTEYLPKYFKDRKALGVLYPAAEAAAEYERVGILATAGTVESGTFPRDIKVVNPKTKVFQNAAPMLVPLIEVGDNKAAGQMLPKYLKPLLNKNIDALVLGCTHYPILKKEIKKIAGKKIKIISQDEIIPKKLKNYLTRHNEVDGKLSKKGSMKILVTKMTPSAKSLAKEWFGANANPKLIKFN